MINRDDLKAYVDGELSPMQMAEVRDAIDRDPVLAREVEELSRLTHTIRASVPMPEVRGLDETLNALRKSRNPMRMFGWPIALVGACGVLFAIVFPVFSQAKSAAKSSSVAFMRAREREVEAAGSFSAAGGQEERAKAKSADAEYRRSSPELSDAPKTSALELQDRSRRSQGVQGKGPAAPRREEHAPVRKSQPQFGGLTARLQSPRNAKVTLGSAFSTAEKDGRDSLKSSAVSEAPVASLSSVADKPLVLMVDSLEDARKKVANLVEHFEGTVSLVPAAVNGVPNNSNELVLMVPVAKAPEAIDVIRTVLTAPLRREDPEVISGLRVPANNAKRDGSDARYFGGQGGAAGGVGGGGFGGGGLARSGAAAPASPPAGAGGPGGGAKAGATGSGPGFLDENRQLNIRTKVEDFTAAKASTAASRSRKISSSARKPAVQLRRIVIVLKKRVEKPNPNGRR